jgi:rhamnogalacturonan acetylesterase
VYTFNKYVTDAARAYIAKGASVIVSSQTPNNLWEGGVFGDGAPRFVEYAALAATDVGEGAWYVDHFAAVAKMYEVGRWGDECALSEGSHSHQS